MGFNSAFKGLSETVIRGLRQISSWPTVVPNVLRWPRKLCPICFSRPVHKSKDVRL